MNRKTLSTLTLALAALAAGNVMAQTSAPVDALAKIQQAHPGSFAVKATGQLSRAAVQANLAEAQRTGDIAANGETGAKLNEVFSANYTATASNEHLSRDAVKAELREALRTGDLVANGETGMKLNEVFAGRYANKS